MVSGGARTPGGGGLVRTGGSQGWLDSGLPLSAPEWAHPELSQMLLQLSPAAFRPWCGLVQDGSQCGAWSAATLAEPSVHSWTPASECAVKAEALSFQNQP